MGGDAITIRGLVALYQRGGGGNDYAGMELKARGERARDELIRMLDATPATKLGSAKTETIVRILEDQFPSQASSDAIERLRSRVTDARYQSGLRKSSAVVRAQLTGQWNDAWWVEHRKMSPPEQNLHYKELLLESSTPADRVFFLVEAAIIALRIGKEANAEAYAREILATPNLATRCSEGVYFGNHVLAVLAMSRGDVAGAKHHLVESAKTPGSWDMRGIWEPDFSLAMALVGVGEREVVFEYFDLCKVFMKREAMIEGWKETIRAGSTPEFHYDWLATIGLDLRAGKRTRKRKPPRP